MIEFSTKNGVSAHVSGPIHEILAETVMMVCAIVQIVSDATELPTHSVAMDMVTAIVGTVHDDEQMERVKSLVSDGETVVMSIDVDALKRDKEDDV